jgi:hypothetical protein
MDNMICTRKGTQKGGGERKNRKEEQKQEGRKGGTMNNMVHTRKGTKNVGGEKKKDRAGRKNTKRKAGREDGDLRFDPQSNTYKHIYIFYIHTDTDR